MTDNYLNALDAMFERLSVSPSLEYLTCAGAKRDGDLIRVTYFGREVTADLKEKTLSAAFGPAPDTGDGLLILAYLLGASPASGESGRYVSFGEIRKASVFKAAFDRSIRSLVSRFGSAGEFLEAGIRAGGAQIDAGDAAVMLRAFPNVPLIYIFHEGDDEFPSSVTVLFDTGITDCMHEENVPTVGTYGLHLIAEAIRKEDKEDHEKDI